MSIVSSLGGGSGFDTVKLVEDLANASRAPKVQMFTERAQKVQAKIGAVAQARSDLESFAKSLSNLVEGGSLQSQPVVSDPSALTATAGAGTRVGTLSGELLIEQLARAQTVYSDYVSSAADPIGQGSMTLAVGAQSYALTIEPGNDSLNGLVRAINSTGSGVTASVASDSNGSRLVLRGESGSAKAFTLSSSDPAFQRFGYGPGGGMILGQAAQDAKFTVDGVAYVRNSNTVTDVFAGVTLTLKKAAPGVPVTLTSSRPSDTLKQTLQDFVAVFNEMKQDLTTARTMTGGDSALRSLERQLGTLLATPLTSNANIKSLSDAGIATNRDGSISINTAKLETALKNYPDEVEALFSPTRDATHSEATDPGIARVLKAMNDGATGPKGSLESLRKRLEQESAALSKDRERMEAREAAYRMRLERQFGSLDSRISGLKATQSYLEQQVKIWTNDGN